MNRVLNDLVINVVNDVIKRSEIPVVIYEAPTGYGKTTSSVNFFKVVSRYGIASSLIHVLPMRSITTQLYCKILNSLNYSNDYCRDFGVDEVLLNSLKGLNISEHDIGYQFMDFIDSSKSPFFLKTVLITTFNSFFYNLIRLSVGEFRKYKKHYEIPRASIFTSAIVFDEAHLYGGDAYVEKAENSLLTAFTVSIKSLTKAYTPVLIETATLPTYLRELLITTITTSNIRPRLVTFRFDGVKCDENINLSKSEITCYDSEYVSECLNIRWHTRIVDDLNYDLIKDLIYSGLKVLIVRNTVEKAVNTYKKLKEVIGNVTLIHGRFTDNDRRIKLGRIISNSSPIVISTQVIEAGVDISFNALITDAATPASIVQRVGRVIRKCGDRKEDREGWVYIIKSEGDGIYNAELTKSFLSRLRDIISQDYMIEWRLPSMKAIDNRISYLKLIEELYSSYKPQPDVERYTYLMDLISRPLISYEDIYEIITRFEDLTYSSLLIPVYVGIDIPSCDGVSNCLNVVSRNSVALSRDFLRKYLSDLVELSGGLIAILYLRCDDELSNCDIIKSYVQPDKVLTYQLFLWKVVGEGITLIPLALSGRAENYSSETGYGVIK